MKASNLISVLLLTSIGLSVAEASIAQSVYKVANATSSKVFVTGQAALTEINALINNDPKPRSMTYNQCGWGKFKESTTSPVVGFSSGGSPLNIGSGADPVCTKDAQGVYSATNDGIIGDVRRSTTGSIWHKGSNTVGAGVVYVSTQSTKKAKVNACGLASFSVTSISASPTASLNIGGTTYPISSMTTRTYPDVCRKIGTASVLYSPATP